MGATRMWPSVVRRCIYMDMMNRKLRMAVVGLGILAGTVLPASAGTKEQLIQIQTQVQNLQDQMSQMKQSFDERMGVMRNLVEQTTDSVNKMNNSVAGLDKSLRQQTTDSGTKVDQLSGQ